MYTDRGTDSKVYYFLFNDIEHSFITTNSSTLATRDQSSNPLNYTQFSVESIIYHYIHSSIGGNIINT